jgi:hypothetical protein
MEIKTEKLNADTVHPEEYWKKRCHTIYNCRKKMTGLNWKETFDVLFNFPDQRGHYKFNPYYNTTANEKINFFSWSFVRYKIQPVTQNIKMEQGDHLPTSKK